MINRNVQIFCFTKNLYQKFPEYRNKYNNLEKKDNESINKLNTTFLQNLCDERIRGLTYASND